MKKFVVETYYTCTFKTVHALDELNDSELSKIDSRTDGEVEVIEVKLNNRKTKKTGEKSKKEILNKESKIKPIIQNISNTISNKPKVNTEPNIKNKTYIKTRFKMPDRRKGYIQKFQ